MSREVCTNCGSIADEYGAILHQRKDCTRQALRLFQEPSDLFEHYRLSRDLMFMSIARLASRRSTCLRGQTGAVIVMDRRPVSLGYNGAPPGLPHCMEAGCEVGDEREGGCIRSIHAEANAIAWAARAGIRVEDGTIYQLTAPCLPCAQLILSAGLSRAVIDKTYRRPEGLELLKSSIMVEDVHGRPFK